MADLYTYFYEQGLRLLRPGGRMSFVVTNKWLRAGYAEELRGLFAERGDVEFIADFGHAKHFFPDADVFPCVVVVRPPDPSALPVEETSVCVIPREAVPQKGLSAAVAAATYPLPRAHFTRQRWTLEPPEVVRLLDKIRRNGVPARRVCGGEAALWHQDGPQRGVPDRHADPRPSRGRRSGVRRDHQALTPRAGHRAVARAAAGIVDDLHAPWH
jgi:hypothetical protein